MGTGGIFISMSTTRNIKDRPHQKTTGITGNGCRERVLRAIRFEKPDRIPLGYSVIPLELFRYGQAFIDLCKRYPNDFYDVGAIIKIPQRDTEHYRADGTYYKEVTDEWGSVRVFYREGISGEIKRPILDDWSKLKTLKVPPVAGKSPAELEEFWWRDFERMTAVKGQRFLYQCHALLSKRKGRETYDRMLALSRETVKGLSWS